MPTISDEIKDKVMSDLLKDCDFDEAKGFLNAIPMEKKHRNLLLRMYAEPTPNKVIAGDMKICERQFYELAGFSRVHAYNGLRAKLRGFFSCTLNSEQEQFKEP